MKPILALLGLVLIVWVGASLKTSRQPRPAVKFVYAPPAETSRSFAMGFSSFVPDTEVNSILKAYDLSRQNSDFRSIQLDAGVPWPEAEQNAPIPKRILDDWGFQKSQCAGKVVLVSITSRGFDGTHLALYSSDQGNNLPLPADWEGLPQNHPRVMKAYLNYARSVIAFWNPDYLAISVEANVIANKSLEVWQQYLELHRSLYEQLKKEHPKLPIFSTIQVEHFKSVMADTSGKAELQRKIVAELNPYQDIMALSVYPYSGKNVKFSEDYFEEFKSYGKPLAISETGWPAQDFTMFGYTTEGGPEAQAQYLQDLLRVANRNNFVFFVNWVAVDYTRLLEKLPKNDQMEFSKSWVYNGLWDENFNAKKALEVWQGYLKLPTR